MRYIHTLHKLVCAWLNVKIVNILRRKITNICVSSGIRAYKSVAVNCDKFYMAVVTMFVAFNCRVCHAVRDARGRCIVAITDYAANWHETGGATHGRDAAWDEGMIERAGLHLLRCNGCADAAASQPSIAAAGHPAISVNADYAARTPKYSLACFNYS